MINIGIYIYIITQRKKRRKLIESANSIKIYRIRHITKKSYF